MAETIDTTDRDLMMQFCSLGVNCEVGVAQRRAGAEPLDLFRWASIHMPRLLDMLGSRFDGIGNPDDIEIRGEANKAMVWHKRYRFLWHAFATVETAEEIHAREVKRMPFLANKLINDISEGNRIFVVKPGPQGALTEADGIACLEALDAYGGNPTLLVVNDGADDVTLGEWAPRLLWGRIPLFAHPADVHGKTVGADWLRLCRMAIARKDMAALERSLMGMSSD